MRRTICHIGNNGITNEHSESRNGWQFLRSYSRWLWRFVSRTLEYCFGMYLGGLLGWFVGWYTGYLYVEYFEPVYLSEFSGLDEIMCWDRLSHIFAGAGVFAGAAIGAAVTFCFSLKTSNNKTRDTS